MPEIVQKLVTMSNTLGSEAYDYIILGEGNSSAKLDEQHFLVKASGTQLGTSTEQSFVKVQFAPVLEALKHESLSDAEVKDLLLNATVDNEANRMPSVETFLHAIILSQKGINYVGHTHPTAINSILCSKKAEEAYSGSLFPDQIVVLGTDPLFIRYTDPGLMLSKAVQTAYSDYIARFGHAPKVIYMQNHGLIAAGKTADDVLNITQMAVKTAKIILRTYMLGGPNFLSDANTNRIETRPDERYRRRMI
ncbi:aldolase [candidate division KSB3 bacterium]|uniref:Aldolase n=1 Tax=candidate division KSB3 bacterium TaxID=2044937 RepID=A0A2G6E3V7_9BACT|nr:MAG: aldolase [candidate division KSB3 bacterium]PIE29347.1 MAG: aldolase [candidate division KSB3 bacterium]